jgi:hypothetical protein
MPRQLNPAWRRKNVSSDHLAKISDSFLSDGPPSGQTADGCQVIPFLLDNVGQEWIVQELCGVLAQRGQQSRWQTLPAATTGTLAEALGTAPGKPASVGGFHLLATTSPADIIHHDLDHVVVLVPSSLDGVMTAYRRIKQLASRQTPDIGVVLVGPRDQHAAWRYFRKLAVGTLRYLDIPLLNLGFLPQQVVPEHGPPDLHRHNFLTRISERLLRSGFHSQYPRSSFESDDGPPA